MLYLYEIKNLYEAIDDFEVSPFETVEIFHIRSEMNEVYYLLTQEEKKELEKCDCKIVENAASLVHHLQEVSDFKNTNRSLEEWWWHLSKVISGELPVAMEIKSI
ncbi:hypothetical protein NLX67_15805 [Domibacillus sp. A3M-37]|jgi:hypothetical protein|uniref:hypothetical protein n=1 Tax=Domibacillus TaxID=1433999 RepID=UPI0020B7A269|nr:hypothetical protein [Domibacillus sp. A3M-37]MCP3763838.1 hypothetical protein [Domibacillus sp. A3M-37]